MWQNQSNKTGASTESALHVTQCIAKAHTCKETSKTLKLVMQRNKKQCFEVKWSGDQAHSLSYSKPSERIFPARRKCQNLTLLPKADKLPGEPSSYKPTYLRVGSMDSANSAQPIDTALIEAVIHGKGSVNKYCVVATSLCMVWHRWCTQDVRCPREWPTIVEHYAQWCS